ncbi:MAG: NAD(P)-binding protein [bacterium]
MAQQPIVFKSWRDLPLMAASLGDTTVNKTGAWRNMEPHHVEQIPPCTYRCPAGNDVVSFVTLTAEGYYKEALGVILQTSPFPATCGRVCPHPCELECNRTQYGEAINIHAIERFLGDWARSHRPEIGTGIANLKEKPTGKRVAIIGSGPAGLSAAYHLLLKGHSPTVFEAHPYPGGMMRLGIPSYRLPRDILEDEIALINSLGAEIRTRICIGKDIPFIDIYRAFDAVLIGVGLSLSRPLGIDGEEKGGVVSGTEVLRRINLGEDPDVGQKVLVVGGGNTAMDVARSLARLGRSVKVMYRRSRYEMPAIAEEVEELLEEAIPIEFLATPVALIHNSEGELVRVKCVRMVLGKPDESGRRKPEPIPGSEFEIEVDTVITAIGETSDLNFLPEEFRETPSWNIPADGLGRTKDEKIFACGDVADGAGTVTAAIGYGRRAAWAIDAYLTGKELPEKVNLPPSLWNRTDHIVRFSDLNLAYFELQERLSGGYLPPKERVKSFKEVRRDLSEDEVIREARRCFSCGTCPACDNCWIFCPDVAVHRVKDDPHRLYYVDYDYCKGCGICAAECPRDCIEMIPVV